MIFSLIFLNIVYFFVLYVFVPYFCFSIREKLIAYYQILNFFTIFFNTSIGVWLGAYYFSNKKEFDLGEKKKDKRNKIVNTLIEELKTLDEQANKIFYLNIKTQTELDLSRTIIQNCFEFFIACIENLNDILEFSNSEIRSIIEFYSFADNSKVVSLLSINLLKKSKMKNEQRDIFAEQIKITRSIFLKKY
ncbi:hypothetical protein AB3N58_17775 (plasmid) [Leptospira sp. WS60.C2]